jgi:putative tryptophan/tyrosine transport system substrate-binding protein
MIRLSRRVFVVGAGASSAALLAGCGRLPGQALQPPTAGRVYRLGYLSGSTPTAQARNLDVFRQTLDELGYAEGQNLAIEYRWGDGNDERLAAPAAELARLPVDVLVVVSTTVLRFAREMTTTVPIVVAGGGPDPVALGFAASYARPGGNVTGVTALARQLFGKRLQLLKDAAPSITRVAILWSAESRPLPTDSWAQDAQAVGVQLHPMELRDSEEFDGAFEAARENADALLVLPGPLGNTHRAGIVQHAAKHHWPAMFPQRQFVEDGGLMAYEASPIDLWRRTAMLVDKILKGASPAEIPIEQPMRFDFVVNLKTARELGLTFPNDILLQVTEVIQ